jgi:hypothetical protein
MTRAVTAQVEQTVSAVPSLKLAVIVAASRSHDWHMLAPCPCLRLTPLPIQSDGTGSVIRAGHGSSGGGEPALAGD